MWEEDLYFIQVLNNILYIAGHYVNSIQVVGKGAIV